MAQAVGTYVKMDFSGLNVITTAETVVATSPAVSSGYPGCIFVLEFELDFLTGATVTGVTFRIRRNSLTGTAVMTGPTIAAAASTQLPHARYAVTDQIAGDVANQLWVLTAVQVAATGNGSVSNVFSRVTTI